MKPDPDRPPPAIPKGYQYERVRERKLPEHIHIKSVILGRDHIFESNQALVRFSPFGMSEHHIINLYNDGGREMAVRFNGFTGHLSFYDEHRGPEEVLEDTEP